MFKVVSLYFEECGLPEEEKQRRRSSRKSNAAPLINPDDYVEMNHIKEQKPEIKQTKQPEIVKEKPKKGYVQLTVNILIYSFLQTISQRRNLLPQLWTYKTRDIMNKRRRNLEKNSPVKLNNLACHQPKIKLTGFLFHI